MSTPDYQVRCIKNVNIANGIYDFRLEKPAGLEFQAGQFVLFDVPLLDNPEDIQTRAFSIASTPEEDELIFVAKLIEGGRASNWIEQGLTAGDTVRLQGPFGRFLLTEEDRDLLFICTSTGVAPFRSQILHALQQGDTRRMDLIFGARTEADLFWMDEFTALAAQYENFHIHFALSQPDTEWSGHTGRVQTVVPAICDQLVDCQVYVCGNPDMTNEIKRLCLEEWGVPKNLLHVEGYI